MRVDRLGVDESVSAVFPPDALVAALDDVEAAASRVDAATGRVDTAVGRVDAATETLDDYQAVVTLEHHDAFLGSSGDAGVEWVHSIQAGVDRFPRDAFRDRGIVLTNSSGIHGDAIGETVAGYVLSFARRLHEYAANQERGEWDRPSWDEAWTVAGETACVVGLGGLGRGIVDRLTGLGLDVVGVRRTPTPEPGVDGVYPMDDLYEAVADARFVVLAVPLTDETRHLFDAAAFEAMREDAYLVNVARGGVVDQPALVDALEDGTVTGAALDVFETEPLPASSPLWELDEVIVTPHCGAYTRDYHRHVATILRESLRRIESGEDPVNRVV